MGSTAIVTAKSRCQSGKTSFWKHRARSAKESADVCFSSPISTVVFGQRCRFAGRESEGLGLGTRQYRESAWIVSQPRLGEDLSRPIPLRQHVHLGLRSQRY